MDSSLILKQKYDNKEIISDKEIISLLNKSVIFKKLLSDFEVTPMNLILRLSEISEIPYSYKNKKVQKWVKILLNKSFTGEGFSFSGLSDDLLVCYNGMIISILIKLRSEDQNAILKGIAWILKYQNFERNKSCEWPGARILKYGGCLKSTPCYIGLVKSVIALSDYRKSDFYKKDSQLESKLKNGLEYILDQEVYKRKSNDKPITPYIDKITFPFTYKTNIIELLRLLKENGLAKDKRCNAAIDLIIKKKKKDGFWRINSIYTSGVWYPFDKVNEPAEWASYIINTILD